MKKRNGKNQTLIAVLIVVVILAVGAWLIFGNQKDVELAPGFGVCNLGDLTDCVNGCWNDYNDRIEDIGMAWSAQRKNCCERHNGVWDADSDSCKVVFPNTDPYIECAEEFGRRVLLNEAEEKRKTCIADCQTTHCQTGKVEKTI